MKTPAWTLIYNSTKPGSRWIGLAWEFFDDELEARDRYKLLSVDDRSPTIRPYNSVADRAKLGGVHHMHGEG